MYIPSPERSPRPPLAEIGKNIADITSSVIETGLPLDKLVVVGSASMTLAGLQRTAADVDCVVPSGLYEALYNDPAAHGLNAKADPLRTHVIEAHTSRLKVDVIRSGMDDEEFNSLLENASLTEFGIAYLSPAQQLAHYEGNAEARRARPEDVRLLRLHLGKTARRFFWQRPA